MNHGRVESASLSIGKVALQAGIGVETIRFYEREGCLQLRRVENRLQTLSRARCWPNPVYQARKGAWIFAEGNQGAPTTQEKLFVDLRGYPRKGRSKDR